MSRKASHDVLLDHRDSDPEYNSQSVVCCRYTMVQYGAFVFNVVSSEPL